MHTLLVAIFISFSLAFSVCAEDSPDTPKGIKIRALAFALHNNLDTLRLRDGKRDLGEIFLETNRFGIRYGVPVRQFSFGIDQEEEKFLPMGSISLPESGRDFIVVFVPIKDGYHVFTIRSDDPAFGSNDSILFNFTPYPIGASLGGVTTLIPSMKREKLKPEIKKGDTYYQATFAYEKNGKMIPFNNTRWPVNPKLKALVFIYINPQTGKPAYRAVSALASE